MQGSECEKYLLEVLGKLSAELWWRWGLWFCFSCLADALDLWCRLLWRWKIKKFTNEIIPKIVILRHNDADSLVIAETSPLDQRNRNCGQAKPRCPFPKRTIQIYRCTTNIWINKNNKSLLMINAHLHSFWVCGRVLDHSPIDWFPRTATTS